MKTLNEVQATAALVQHTLSNFARVARDMDYTIAGLKEDLEKQTGIFAAYPEFYDAIYLKALRYGRTEAEVMVLVYDCCW